MKITEVNIKEPGRGLKPIEMKKLGDVVLIAGKTAVERPGCWRRLRKR